MLSPRLDPRGLLLLLRGISAWRLTLAVMAGLLVLPAQPASALLTWLFAPVGIALWYLAFGAVARLLTAVDDRFVLRAAHVAVGLGAVWSMRLFEPLLWLFAWTAIAAAVYAVAGEACRRRLRARVL